MGVLVAGLQLLKSLQSHFPVLQDLQSGGHQSLFEVPKQCETRIYHSFLLAFNLKSMSATCRYPSHFR